MNQSEVAYEAAELAPEPTAWVPQFGLRALLGLVTLMAVLFAVAGVLGARWGVVFAWFVVLGAAHVAANTWGARRRRAEARRAVIVRPELSAQSRPGSETLPLPVAKSIMRHDDRTESLAVGVAIVVAITAGVVSAALLTAFCGDRCGVSGVVLGGISAGVIGGLLAFAATSFFECASRAWAEAVSADSPPKQDRN